MFSDLDASLRALFTDPTAPPDLRTADVSFDTPDAGFRPAQATVDLFLYEVTENRELRDESRVMTRTASGYASRLPSLRVDCTYLATTWSSHSGGFKAEEEHRLLGLLLIWLSRFPVIDGVHLQGGLKNPPQPFPVSTVVARTRDGQGMAHFWSALGIPPRPAVSITVTISVDPFDEVEEFPEVRDVHLLPTALDHPALAGRVRDQDLTPLRDATVTLLDDGGREVGTRTTDEEGAFAFPDVAFAVYLLRAQAAGHEDAERAVRYARDSQVHDVVLPRP